MPEDFRTQISGLFGGLRRKATEAVAAQEAAFARGKIAGNTVTDDSGEVIVEAGHHIDDEVIARAEAARKLHALAAAAANAQAQDLREKARNYYESTEDGKESRSLGSVEEFVEARRYVGRIAVLEVSDIRGNVIVPAGSEVREETVQAAREAGQLGALIYSAQQAQPDRRTAGPSAAPAYKLPFSVQQPQQRRSVPLVQPEEPERPD